MSLGEVFVSEVIGTGMLTLLGVGVVANVLLGKTKGRGVGGDWLLVNIGWGLAVMAGVFAAYKSGAHLNPAVTFGIMSSGADTYGGVADVDVDFGSTIVYLCGEMVGAFLGAVLAWAAYKQHYDDPDAEPAAKLGTFSTGPEIRNYAWNFVTEVIATFVLVYIIVSLGPGDSPAELGALYVALLVVGIGASLGGPTGYAINPARDLGPRIAHFLLPIKGKGGSDWSYAWVPIAGPIVGGVIAGLLSQVTF
ncbi:MIP/aquaporin family protein [Solicola gregarius]|uniref:Aquaporin family protein n=1 Tax=Solicola gregarius TaxID=2908642 RepID=A0AA46YJD5_9ACTN|nr:MIP/aquaporin family protein [Solicola gregarius]UYM04227.1 aquaporin family protein [Solicola gregarius]